MGATIFGRIHNKNCCCDNGCGGCCWLADENDPSQAVPISFDVIAANCSELDSGGNPHTFTPMESLTGTPEGACGPCTWMLWNDIGSGNQGWSVGGYQDNDPLPDPCSWHIAAALVCLAPDDGSSPTETTDTCCANVRLLMAANNEFSGSRLLTDFTTEQSLTAYANAAQTLIDGAGNLNWGKLQAPTSCSCDETTGMHAEFPIDGWVTPACSGDPPYDWECCAPNICNLSGGVLQF